MKRKLVIFTSLFAICLLVACNAIWDNETTTAIQSFPTATNHFLFYGEKKASTPVPNPDTSLSGTPTVAPIFLDLPRATPTPDDIITSAPDLGETDKVLPNYSSVPVYQDALNPNWEVQKDTGMEFNLESTSPVFDGLSAISFTPSVNYGRLLFTVSDESQEAYPRNQVAALSFQLYSGEEPLPLDELAVTVVGSNSQPYWSADDNSVTVNDELPVFSETRLYYLGFNYEIPADTWVTVELDLDQLIYDPEYEYVTGFYLKTEAGFSRALSIDDISIILFDDDTDPTSSAVTPTANPKTVSVKLNMEADVHPISELIYGVSGAAADYLQALRPSLNSWGGDASSRYNWELGNAWNAGRDDSYRNHSLDTTSGSASDDFISQSLDAGVEVRLSLSTLGWVARNADPDTCSFPLPDGGCGDAEGASCQEPGPTADPYLANIPSYLDTTKAWLQHLFHKQSFAIRFLAMDNEPELWGITHYDVHPKCTTYNEILKRYLMYADAAHGFAPEAELSGPVTSGWTYYWDSAAGEEDRSRHDDQDFLPWFLDRIRQNDRTTGWRSLDVLDLHYYPEGVYNDQVDDETAALRLRSTRSLWDESYVDESSIDEAVYLIPRMKALIEEHYPGTKLGISEWNWGADETMNGALAIADVLGIFGREDLYYAAYWQYPPLNSPGFFAFKMYTNYDDNGGHFGDTSVSIQSEDMDLLSSYAALDSASGDLHVMLVNKQVEGEILAQLDLGNFTPDDSIEMYRYDVTHPEGIAEITLDVSDGELLVSLPAYSITLLVIQEVE